MLLGFVTQTSKSAQTSVWMAQQTMESRRQSLVQTYVGTSLGYLDSSVINMVESKIRLRTSDNFHWCKFSYKPVHAVKISFPYKLQMFVRTIKSEWLI